MKRKEFNFLNSLEGRFLTRWRSAGGPEPRTQYHFHPTRKWRFDYAFPDAKIAIEVEGGTWINGGHSRGGGQLKDREKFNAAGLLGWRVLRFTLDRREAAMLEAAAAYVAGIAKANEPIQAQPPLPMRLEALPVKAEEDDDSFWSRPIR